MCDTEFPLSVSPSVRNKLIFETQLHFRYIYYLPIGTKRCIFNDYLYSTNPKSVVYIFIPDTGTCFEAIGYYQALV